MKARAMLFVTVCALPSASSRSTKHGSEFQHVTVSLKQRLSLPPGGGHQWAGLLQRITGKCGVTLLELVGAVARSHPPLTPDSPRGGTAPD